MKKLLFIPLLFLSIVGYSQMNTFGGIGLRVNDTTTYQTNAAAYHTAGYYDIYFNNQATNDHFDVWNGSSYDHIFSFSSGGNFWKNAGTTTLTAPVLITSADSIGIAANGTNIRSGRDVISSFVTGNPVGGNEYAQVGVYRDATFGSYAFLATSNSGASVIARMDVQSWPGGEGSADIDADTIHISQNEVNVLKIVPSGAWQIGSGLTAGTAGNVLTSNGSAAAPTWSPGVTNTSSALTDGSTITITGVKHTLTSTQATITWTLSQTPDFQTTDIILNATSTTWTFPAGALCKVDGTASGNNTATLSGVSGDHYIMSIYKDGTNYRVAIANFGQ